ncbi:MAB_1171c family putative transporter [Streptomyces sp. NPDC000133]|uniref:MAB_1171c family putative transporter n=1 Tax=Streptomyces sp. NPDC000133 TaxID=3364535 RepID=UPI0036CF5ABA
MPGGLTYAIAVAMTIIALWRLPAALRFGEPLRRALWGCSAGFAVAMWCRVPEVKYTLDRSPITDLSALLKYMSSMIAILAVLRYITAIYGKPRPGRTPRHIAVSQRVSRVAHASALGAVTAMIVLFFTAVDRSRPSVDFATDHAGQWGAATFVSIDYIYLSAASATCAYQWFRASRQAEVQTLRIGLTLMATSALIYAIYPAVRIFSVWTPTGASAVMMRSVSDTVNVVAACLWAAGASIPTTHAVVTRWTSWRTLNTLYPLWRDLTGQFPHLAFQPPASRLRELTRTSPPLDVRLDRWTQEIADVVEQLRHHATPNLLIYAKVATEALADPEPAAEAYWIRAALQNARSGLRAELPVEGLPDKPLADSEAESFWLARVQDTYRTLTHEQVRQLLNKAGAPGASGTSPAHQTLQESAHVAAAY